MIRKEKFFLFLTLALTMVTQEARAEWTGGTYTATTDETLGTITVRGDAMLIINEGVTVTVNGGNGKDANDRIGIKVSGGTLTIVGPGTLVVNGTNGIDGVGDVYRGNFDLGGTAISGNIIVQGATVIATGGAGGKGQYSYIDYGKDGGTGGAAFSGSVTIYSGTINAQAGNGGEGGISDNVYGGAGGYGGDAFTGTLTYYGGTVNANGGAGGKGGWSQELHTTSDSYGPGKAFANSVNFQNTPTTLTNGSSTISQSEVTNHTTVNISGSGVEVLPPTDDSGAFLISSIDDWTTFANAINTGSTFSGKTVKLTNDLSGVTIMAGTSTKSFCGTFDGQGNTLDVNITSSGTAAPFYKVDGATFRNLLVTGSVQTTMSSGADHTAGLISRADGSVNIQNVRVSATVTGNTYYAGFIGHGNSATITMTGCVFDGTLTENAAGETQHAGGFIGWGESMNITMNDCLFDGTCTIGTGGSGSKNFHPVGYYCAANSVTVTPTLTNVYYTVAPSAQTTSNSGYPLTGGEKNALVLYNDKSNADALDNYNGQTDVVLFGRKLYRDGSWNTLCLPFDLTEEQLAVADCPLKGATVKTLTSSSFDNGTLTLNFTDYPVSAGTPYIVKWTNTGDPIENPVFKNVEIKNNAGYASSTYVTFRGTFSPYTLEARRSVLYLGAGNMLYYPSADVTIGSCRGYFQLKGITAGDPEDPKAGVHSFVLNFGDESTGIISLSTESKDFKDNAAWYTLDGRRLSGKPTQRGIYINNGKKVVIK